MRREHREIGASRGTEALKQTFAIVVERAPNGYGAYAPDLPASFVTAETLEGAFRGARAALASYLRLFAEMGDRLPQPRPETAPGLERANRTAAGSPADPGVRVLLAEIGPDDAPPSPRSLRPLTPPASPRRRETFAVVFESGDNGFGAYCPDLPGCVSIGDTDGEARETMRAGLADFVQRLVDDGEPIPTKRLSVEAALAAHHREYGTADSPPDDGRVFAEPITVEVRPPRPGARRRRELWRDARRRRIGFEERASPTAPLAPGASRRDAWAAVFETAADGVTAHVPDLPACRAEGGSPEVARARLRDAIADHLERRREAEGVIPLPRRTPTRALAHHHRECVEYGLEVPDPDATVELIPVEVAAPSIACAS